MLFTCIFQTFYKNRHNFRAHTYFHLKFGALMSNYLLYKLWKFETKILFFDLVIEILLGGYFFFTHSVYMYVIAAAYIVTLPRGNKG